MQERFQRKPVLGEVFCVLVDELEIGTTGAAKKRRDPGYMVSQVVFQVGQYFRVCRVGVRQNIFEDRSFERMVNSIKAITQRRCDSRDHPIAP
jgi:hypothetical protein